MPYFLLSFKAAVTSGESATEEIWMVVEWLVISFELFQVPLPFQGRGQGLGQPVIP